MQGQMQSRDIGEGRWFNEYQYTHVYRSHGVTLGEIIRLEDPRKVVSSLWYFLPHMQGQMQSRDIGEDDSMNINKPTHVYRSHGETLGEIIRLEDPRKVVSSLWYFLPHMQEQMQSRDIGEGKWFNEYQ